MPLAGICAGGWEQSQSLPRPFSIDVSGQDPIGEITLKRIEAGNEVTVATCTTATPAGSGSITTHLGEAIVPNALGTYQYRAYGQRYDGTPIASSVVTVAVTNTAPMAVDDAQTIAVDTLLTLPASNLLANDTDADGDPLTLTTVGTATQGGATVALVSGQITYTPPTGWEGTDTFTYTIVDTHGATAIGTVHVTVAHQGGMTANYYDDTALTDLKTTRIDPTVEFSWGTAIPTATAITAPETYTVRWTGDVSPRYAETYTFTVIADDGVRLWVDDQLLIDHWEATGVHTWTGTLALPAEQRTHLRLEYCQQSGTAQIQLRWSSARQADEVIPTTRLYPNALPTVQLLAPVEAATFSAPATVLLVADAADADDGIQRVEFYAGDSKIGEATTVPYQWTWTGVPAGDYLLTARAIDTHGAVTIAVGVPITIAAPQNHPPTVTLIAPAAAQTFSPGTVVTLAALATDTEGALDRVEFLVDGTEIGETTTVPYTVTWTAPMTPGSYTVTAQAYDLTGLATVSDPLTLTIGETTNQRPTVTITCPLPAATITAPTAVTLAADAVDADGTITKVEWYDGLLKIAEQTSAPYTGTWATPTIGTHLLTARAYDALGTIGVSAAVLVTVEAPGNQPPTVTMLQPVTGTRCTGGEPIWLEADATDPDGTIAHIAFYDGDTLLGDATELPYALTWENATSGAHTLTAKAYDNVGAMAVSIPVSLTVNMPPTVSLSTSPTAETTIIPGTTVSLTATTTDSDGTIVRVSCYVDGDCLGEDTDGTDGWQWVWASAPTGIHSIVVVAEDNAGATASTDLTLTVNTLPTVQLTSPLDLTTVSVPLTLTASAADLDGTIQHVDFYLGEHLLGTATTAPYQLTCTDWTGYPAGTYVLTAKAYDDLGACVTSAPVTVTVAGQPTVQLTNPVANQVLSLTPAQARAGAGLTVPVTAVATDPDGGIAKVEFYQDGVKIGERTTAPYTVSWYDVCAGVYTLTAKATDTQGASVVSAAITCTVNAPPTVQLTAPINEDTMAFGAPITLAAIATDLEGAVSRVDFLHGSTVVGTTTTAPYTCTWTPATEGTYQLTARAYDAQDVMAEATPVTITVTSHPIVQFDTLTNGTVLTLGEAVAIATHATGTVSRIDLTVVHNRVTTVVDTATTNPATLTWTPEATGSYRVILKAYDAQGELVSTAVRSVVATVPPTVSLTGITDGMTLTDPIAVTATAADSDGIIRKVEFYAVQDGTETLIGSDTGAPYTCPWANAGSGSYAIVAKAYDNLGAVTTSTAVQITVNTRPQVTVTAPTAGQLLASPITLTAEASDSDGSIQKVEFFATNAGVTTKIGEVTSAPYTLLWTVGAGCYTVTAKATDDRGATTTSAPVNLAVTTPPTVRIIAPGDDTVFSSAAPITLQADAADLDGSIVKVEFYDTVDTTTTLLGSVTSAPYQWAWTTPGTGPHSITAVATDDSGQTATSTPVTLSVSPASPSIQLIEPVTSPEIAGIVFRTPATIPLQAQVQCPDGTITQVEFFADGVSVGTATTAPYQATWTGATPGSHALTATVTVQTTGGTTLTATSAPVNVDVTGDAPAAWFIAPVQYSWVTTPATVTLVAQAFDPNGTITQVQFYEGQTVVGSDSTGSDGWSYAWVDVPVGSHTIAVTATDNDGVVSSPVTVTFTVSDKPTPSVKLVEPGAGYFPSGATIPLQADVADPGKTASYVEFYANGASIGRATSEPYTTTWTNAQDGYYTLTAKVFDQHGQASPSWNEQLAWVGNDSPAIWMTSPSDTLYVTAGATTTLAAQGIDLNGTIARVDFYDGPALLGTAAYDTTGASYTWTGISAGEHTITAIAYDDLGQGSSATSPITVYAYEPGAMDLWVNLTAPGTSTSMAAPAQLTLAAEALDDNGEIARVEFYVNNSKVGEDSSAPYTYEWGTVTATGMYTVTAVAVEAVTGRTVTSSPVTITLTNPAPLVSFISPTTYDWAQQSTLRYATPASVTLVAEASDQNGSITSVAFYDGTTLIGSGTHTTGAIWSFIWTNIPAGTHTVTAIATDNTGLQSSTSSQAIIVENPAPMVTITAPWSPYVTAGNIVLAPVQLPLGADAFDDNGSVVRVDFYINGTQVGTDATAPYACAWTGTTAGNYTLTAVATDNDGATTTSDPLYLTLTNYAPELAFVAPALSFDAQYGPHLTYQVQHPQSILLQVEAYDRHDTVTKVEFFESGTQLPGTVTHADGTTAWSLPWLDPTVGSHLITAVATDSFGATTTVALQVTIENPAPTVTIVSPADDTWCAGPTDLTITAEATDVNSKITGVEFYVNGTKVGDGTQASAGSLAWSFAWTDVQPGTYSLEAKATDEDGVVTSSATVTTEVRVSLASVDLDIDSDNNNGFDAPERSEFEDALEANLTQPGKLFVPNDGDADQDGIPDYADFQIAADTHFVPVVLSYAGSVSSTVPVFISLSYDASDPSAIAQNGGGYALPAYGHLRLWRKDATATRNPASIVDGGDYLPGNGVFTADQLGLSSTTTTVTLYLEGVSAVDDLAAGRISVTAWADDGMVLRDDVIATAIKINSISPVDHISVADDQNLVAAYTADGGQAVVQADLQPKAWPVQQLLRWNAGSPGTQPDLRTVPLDSPSKTDLAVNCLGLGTVTRTAWVVKVDLGLDGTSDAEEEGLPAMIRLNVDDDDSSATANYDGCDLDEMPVKNEDDLPALKITVEPAGAGGYLALTKGGKTELYTTTEKAAVQQQLSWDLTTRLPNHPELDENPPKALFVEGRQLSTAVGDQLFELTYTWGGAAITDRVRATIDAHTPSDATLAIYTLKDRNAGAVPSNLDKPQVSPIGGTVAVVLTVKVGVHEAIDATSEKATIRVKDNYAGYPANAKAQNDYVVDLTTTQGWYQLINQGTPQEQWAPASVAPNAENTDTKPRVFRHVETWNTQTGPSVVYTGTTGFAPPMGHNGEHTVSLVKVNKDPAEALAFEAYNIDTQTWGDPYDAGPLPLQPQVKNLVVTNLSSSNGTIDYFKYDPDPESPYNRPAVSFTVEDEGDCAGHTYKSYVLIQPTKQKLPGTDFLKLLNTYGYIAADAWILGGVTPLAQNVSLPWEGRITTGVDTQTGFPILSDKDQADWGTYTYDVIVEEYNSDGSFNELFAYKWPYCLTDGGHDVWRTDVEDNDEDTILRCSYILDDSVESHPWYTNFVPPTNINMTAVGPCFQEPFSPVSGGTDIGEEYGGKDENLDGTKDGIFIGRIDGSIEQNRGYWRVIFTGEDNCWIGYRRDHEPSRMLAYNLRARTNRKWALFVYDSTDTTGFSDWARNMATTFVNPRKYDVVNRGDCTSVTRLNKILDYYENIGMLVYCGHGGPGVLYLSLKYEGAEYNIGVSSLDATPVNKLHNKNFAEGSKIYLFSCHSGEDVRYEKEIITTSIARQFSNHFNAIVVGAKADPNLDAGTKFYSVDDRVKLTTDSKLNLQCFAPNLGMTTSIAQTDLIKTSNLRALKRPWTNICWAWFKPNGTSGDISAPVLKLPLSPP